MLEGVWLALASDLGIRLRGCHVRHHPQTLAQPGTLTRILLHANKHKYITLYRKTLQVIESLLVSWKPLPMVQSQGYYRVHPHEAS